MDHFYLISQKFSSLQNTDFQLIQQSFEHGNTDLVHIFFKFIQSLFTKSFLSKRKTESLDNVFPWLRCYAICAKLEIYQVNLFWAENTKIIMENLSSEVLLDFQDYFLKYYQSIAEMIPINSEALNYILDKSRVSKVRTYFSLFPNSL